MGGAVEGDAFETLSALDDVFDVVLLDAKKDDYERYFDLARERVDPGGLVVADNVLSHVEMLGAYSGAAGRPRAFQRDGTARQRARDHDDPDVAARLPDA